MARRATIVRQWELFSLAARIAHRSGIVAVSLAAGPVFRRRREVVASPPRFSGT